VRSERHRCQDANGEDGVGHGRARPVGGGRAAPRPGRRQKGPHGRCKGRHRAQAVSGIGGQAQVLGERRRGWAGDVEGGGGGAEDGGCGTVFTFCVK
jgi:hypothetical protein